MIEAPWFEPTQKVAGVVELSTNTRRIVRPQRWPTRFSTAAMRHAGELLGMRAQHALDGSDPGRQTDVLGLIGVPTLAHLIPRGLLLAPGERRVWASYRLPIPGFPTA